MLGKGCPGKGSELQPDPVPQVRTKGAECMLVQSRRDVLHGTSQTEDVVVSKALLQGHEMGWSGA